jgi:hypothetical protein
LDKSYGSKLAKQKRLPIPSSRASGPDRSIIIQEIHSLQAEMKKKERLELENKIRIIQNGQTQNEKMMLV